MKFALFIHLPTVNILVMCLMLLQEIFGVKRLEFFVLLVNLNASC